MIVTTEKDSVRMPRLPEAEPESADLLLTGRNRDPERARKLGALRSPDMQTTGQFFRPSASSPDSVAV